MPNVLAELKNIDDARVFAENIVSTVREPLLVLDSELRIVFANTAFHARFQTAGEEPAGKLLYELGNGQWDIPRLREALGKIIPEQSHFDDYEVEHVFPYIGRRIMLLNGRQVRQSGEQVSYILLAIEDVTDRVTAERKLRESEEKFRGFIQTINSIIIKFDREGRILFFNHFAEKIFGYDEQEVLGKPMVGTILPERDEEGQDLRAMMQDVVQRPGQYYFKQTEGRKKDGNKVWFQWSAKEFRDDEGNVNEVLVDGNDITEEMDYRRMLQEMRGLTESSPDIMARFDSGLRLIYGNPLFMGILGRSGREVLGKTIREIGLPEEKAAKLEDALRNAHGEKSHLKTVLELGGRTYHVQVVAEDGQRRSFRVYAADITERSKMEEALRRSEFQLRALLSYSPDIIFRMNRQLEYTYVNPSYERITGMPKERFIGRTNRQLGMPREMVEFWETTMAAVINMRAERAVEFEISAFFGRRYFSARIIPEFDRSGLVEAVLVLARDITEKKRIEEEVASLKR